MIRAFAILTFFLSLNARASEHLGTIELAPMVTVSSRGVFLSDLVAVKGQSLPKVVLAPAPPVGRPVVLTRFQIADLLAKKAPEAHCTNWTGADRVRIIRATRILDESAIKDLLTTTLQRDYVKERGELELHLARPWNSLAIPDDPIIIKVVEMPSLGVSPHFICRFELLVGGESYGTFPQPLQARIWREIYVARSGLTRGQLLRDADVGLDRRDILSLRDFMIDAPIDDPFVELRENVQSGSALTQRSLRLRAVVKRGRMVDALVQDDTLTISVKAEVLEDGVPGQLVRLRNLRSKREFRGKVQDEQTVTVVF